MKTMEFSKLLCAVALLATGCASVPELSPEGKDVKLMKSDPPAKCKMVGDVSGSASGSGWGNVDPDVGAKNDLRNKAVKMGANYVRLEGVVPSDDKSGYSKLTGTAFKCP